jgi:oligosaccharide repeat unit polymerase
MSLVSWIGFSVCLGIILSVLPRGADPLSPARVFGFTWSFAIALADLKLSALQSDWNFIGWALLLTGISAFLVGVFVAYVLNIKTRLIPIREMRELLQKDEVLETRLFWLICVSSAVYGAAYLVNFLVKGWLPIEAAGRQVSRVEFNVTGLSFLTYLVPSIFFFIVLYFLKVRGEKRRKIVLSLVSLIVLGSFLLFVSRFQFFIVIVVCGTFFYYATHHIRLRTMLSLFAIGTGFFYWISSIRFSHVIATYLYWSSRMRFPKAYAYFTEPYMYCVMNLENFARAVNRLDYHTYGYYTFDFVTALTGLKYPVYEYFHMDRLPYLISGYNTYTAFWLFFCDFGVIGLALIPWALGFGSGLLYYRMRSRPSIGNVTAYGVAVFVMLFSFFVFPLSFLWFELNLLVMYLFLRWTVVPRKGTAQSLVAPARS